MIWYLIFWILERFINQIIPNRTILVLDHIHHLMNHPKMKSFIVRVAENSVFTKTYNVIILASSMSTLGTITSWNSSIKIRKATTKNSKWKGDEWRVLANKLQSNITEKEFALSLISGTPGYLIERMQSSDHTITKSLVQQLCGMVRW